MQKNRKPESGPILVPVDFSPYSTEALVWAARLSERLQLPLRVLHVVHDPESAPGYYGQSKNKEQLRRIEEPAAEMMAQFLDAVARDHPDLEPLQGIEPILVIGLPVSRIIEMADKLDASMIAMGSQGRTGLPHMLLGSKAERIAQLSPIPVTIVKGPKKKKHDDL